MKKLFKSIIFLTLRVKQKQDVLKLERNFNKCYLHDGVRVCNEYSEPIDNLPMRIVLDENEYFYIGNLVTVGKNYEIDDNMISLDMNYYLGHIDYELKIESDTEVMVPKMIKETICLKENKLENIVDLYTD